MDIPENEATNNLKSFLPCYAKVLTATNIEEFTIEDINQLQKDLEYLLSTVVLQRKALRFKQKLLKHTLLRKANNEKYNLFIKNSTKKKRTNHMIPVLKKASCYDILQNPEIPKSTTSDRYWLSVDPICSDVTKDSTLFLDNMIKECATHVDINLPEFRERFFLEWAEKSIEDEQVHSSLRQYLEQSPAHLPEDSIFKQINYLPSALQKQLEKSFTNEKDDDDARENYKVKKTPLPNRSKFHRKLRQAFLKKHIGKNTIKSNEVVMETRKNVSKLQIINNHNLKQLKRLKEVALNNLQQQEIRESLVKTEDKLLIMYRKIIALKDTPEANASEVYPKLNDEDEAEAKNILNTHNNLLQEFNSLLMPLLD